MLTVSPPSMRPRLVVVVSWFWVGWVVLGNHHLNVPQHVDYGGGFSQHSCLHSSVASVTPRCRFDLMIVLLLLQPRMESDQGIRSPHGPG